MPDYQYDLDSLESSVPELSAAVVNEAYLKALNSGLRVYVSGTAKAGVATTIYEVSLSGEKKEIKQIEPPMEMPAGTTARIP